MSYQIPTYSTSPKSLPSSKKIWFTRNFNWNSKRGNTQTMKIRGEWVWETSFPHCHSLAIHISVWAIGSEGPSLDVWVAHTNNKMGTLPRATTITQPPYTCPSGLQLIHMSTYVACVVHINLLGCYIILLFHMRKSKLRKHARSTNHCLSAIYDAIPEKRPGLLAHFNQRLLTWVLLVKSPRVYKLFCEKVSTSLSIISHWNLALHYECGQQQYQQQRWLCLWEKSQTFSYLSYCCKCLKKLFIPSGLQNYGYYSVPAESCYRMH